jgi:hypothetical protein
MLTVSGDVAGPDRSDHEIPTARHPPAARAADVATSDHDAGNAPPPQEWPPARGQRRKSRAEGDVATVACTG